MTCTLTHEQSVDLSNQAAESMLDLMLSAHRTELLHLQHLAFILMNMLTCICLYTQVLDTVFKTDIFKSFKSKKVNANLDIFSENSLQLAWHYSIIVMMSTSNTTPFSVVEAFNHISAYAC